MGKKMKKLICALLASAMLVSSVGMIAFADEPTTDTADTAATDTVDTGDKDVDAPDVEEEPEATEEPAATEAPAVSTSAYDNDNYYQKALALCSSLGIISGYEDGSVKPDSKVTRAEMASIVLRMLAITSWSPYQNGFTDVTTAHWAADQIQSAQDANIISGMGDGTFVPDGDVTYAQVVVMLVNAMNYQDDANYYGTNDGHWASGYMKAAALSDLDLLKNAEGTMDEATDRGVVIKMVYNALLGQYKEIDGYENGGALYRAKGTLAKAKFDVIDKKGVLMGTSKTGLTNTDLQENQIEILEDKADKAEVFDCSLKGLEDYLAQKVTYYYKQNSGKTPEVLAVTYDASKSETYTIDDPDDIENVEGFDSGAGTIKINGVSKAKECSSDVTIVYNGKVVTAAQKEALGEELNDLMIPEKGSVKLVKSDNSYKTYDVVFVDSYETMVVSNASAEKLIGKMSVATEDKIGATKSVTINLDDTEDRTVTVTKAGTEVKVRNLKKNDVASIKRSLDDTVVDIVVTGESITGKATSISKKFNNSKATINGDKYDVANVAADDLKTGTQCVFYLDMFGRIAYIEGSTGGRLDAGEKYGWLMDAYLSENGDDYIVKIMSSDGKADEYTFASKVDYWAPSDLSGSETKSADAMGTIVKDLLDNDAFPHMWVGTRHTDGMTADGERRYSWAKSYSVRLVKFKANSSKELTRLYGAVNIVNEAEKYYSDTDYVKNSQYITDPYVSSAEATRLKDSDALIFDMTNKSGSTLVGGLVGGYVITDDVIEFGVPKTISDYKKADGYTVKNVTAAQYNLRENGLADDYIMADFDGTSPAAIIRFIDDAEEAVNPADMDNVGGSAAMVVDEIDVQYDEDDNTIYTINGYTAGTAVSVTTKKTSALGELTGYNDKKYATTNLWKATDDQDSSPLTNFIGTGDIIITDGTYILLYADVDKIYDELKEGKAPSKYVQGSETRNYFWFDRISDSDTSDTAWMRIGTNVLSADVSLPMDIVEIDLSKDKNKAISISDDVATIADVQPYSDEETEYDYGFARFANKGSLQEVIIYRIKPAK